MFLQENEWSIFRSILNVQVPSPSSGRAEDPGRHKAEGQGQLAQRHPHEGVLLLPQPPLHFLRAAGVSQLSIHDTM